MKLSRDGNWPKTLGSLVGFVCLKRIKQSETLLFLRFPVVDSVLAMSTPTRNRTVGYLDQI